MKWIVQFLAGVTAIVAAAPAAFAQTAQTQVNAAAAQTKSALAATGLPSWVWIVIAALVVLAIVWSLARRRRAQAIIKTRLG